MTFNFKDMRPLVIDCDTDTIRAAFAIGELFPAPVITIRACYAVPTASSSKSGDINGDSQVADGQEAGSKSGWLVGEELLNAQKDGRDRSLEWRWPFRPSEGAEDWEGREFVISHVYALAGINIPSNTIPLLLIPPASPPLLPLSTQASYTQFAFETINSPMFSILPAPLAGLFALGATTGIVIYIGPSESSVFLVTDSIVRWECTTTADVGRLDCEAFFEGLLMEDEDLDKELKAAAGKESLQGEEKRKLVKEVAEFVWKECTGPDIEVPALDSRAAEAIRGVQEEEDESFDVAKKLAGDATAAPAVSSHKSKKQQAQAVAAANRAAADAAARAAEQVDLIVVTIPSLPEKEIQLGPVRHRLCEPLLTGKTVGGDTVWEAVGRAIESASLSLGEKLAIWDGVAVIGETAKIQSFSPALVTYLSPYLLSSAELVSDCQPSKLRLLSIPEYFANYRKSTTDLAPFLGGQLVARVAFTETQGKHSISKIDYNYKGPQAIYTVIGEDR
ncbi:hypothetical protein L202_08247 [Cryptococcus amylolentus CBS 6039]|uniref:RNA polymerase II transcription factor n=2 Tax=Cryptococcus amylolentus TaxID=104669 RepID=A0A1E3H946_9TREE|nr:hypothetical protein L202_08247 [Cryptococcus amylolentus CBS 6039]ODN72814.1 hypothetical protein L202_08247 [Cryptococcus amylolentus CBS 6039]ODN98008.1 hypothetical protein I350_07649 [Cryptococcus amylolentus CBS 6273]